LQVVAWWGLQPHAAWLNDAQHGPERQRSPPKKKKEKDG
jgi:hypothetical protein